ncbi:anoctamin-8-like [Oppia nitens]|uniref:anoctamin-8-like n=1 Tax=Oppia nitens TaxID=1686743 RepID=UPI0023DB4D6E|nr:anoctamin-8-like [Oppia nitens]
MDFDDNFSSSSTSLRKRYSSTRKSSLKAEIKNIIEKQTQDIQEAGAHLWHRQSQSSVKYDVILIISPKGYHIIDSLVQILTERLPQLVVEIKPHSHYKEQAFYLTATDDFLVSSAHQLGYRTVSTGQSLTSLERQTLILQNLNSLRYNQSDEQITENELKLMKLKPNDAIIAKLISSNLIKQVLPLHNEIDLSLLRRQWVSAFFSFQPLDKICEYFGHKIATYFAFLGFYTLALIFPSILGIFITFYGNNNNAFDEIYILSFTVLNIIWSTVFLQKWKHTNNQLLQKWGSNQIQINEQSIRPLFRDKSLFNLFNIEFERKLIKYFISIPVIGICLVVIFGVMIAVLNFQTYWDNVVIDEWQYPIWTKYIPKIILAILINIFDAIYYYIAVWLNNKENYEFETTHENNLILKLILFQFMNSFVSLFYIAFYIGDMDKLHEQLAALLITRQVIGNIKETLLPFIFESYKLSSKLHKIKINEISTIELEANMPRYESTFDDYLELIIQFGYVMLFSSTFPLAAVFALFNNLIEIRSDAFKLCVLYQRPFGGHRVQNIGQWEDVLNAIAYIAIIVNCALIVKTKQISKITAIEDEVQLVLIGVILEHLLLALKWLSPFIF